MLCPSVNYFVMTENEFGFKAYFTYLMILIDIRLFICQFLIPVHLRFIDDWDYELMTNSWFLNGLLAVSERYALAATHLPGPRQHNIHLVPSWRLSRDNQLVPCRVIILSFSFLSSQIWSWINDCLSKSWEGRERDW